MGEVGGKAALVLRWIPWPICALTLPSPLHQQHFSPCAQWGMVTLAVTPLSMWGLGGSRLLSSATRLVLPPPAPSPFHVRNALAIIMLTPVLESMTELHQTCSAISHSPGSACPPSKKGQVTLACTRPSQPPLLGLRFSFLFCSFLFSVGNVSCCHLPDCSSTAGISDFKSRFLHLPLQSVRPERLATFFFFFFFTKNFLVTSFPSVSF